MILTWLESETRRSPEREKMTRWIGQTYDTTPEMLHRRYEIRDKLMAAACAKVANLSNIVLEPFKEG